ncbi:MAG: HDOD domain-containing protein [Hahellaceae bacterium]|nr:HDOD domain-containing protein [Hahellaceae bacterium]
MTDLETKIEQDLKKAIETDKIVLPTLPEVALKVREVAENRDSSIMDLTKVISNDAAITARIIRVCNSPLLRGAREITNLGMAVNRLGMAYTANLATGLAMEQMFQATTDMIDKRMRSVWQNSTEVAGIAHVLAQHYSKVKPDQATLAGLIHHIGALPILTYIEEKDISISNVALDNLIDKLHPAIGELILKKWDFSPEMQSIPREHVNYTRVVQQADLADVIMVAKLQSLLGKPNAPELDWKTVSAFQRLGLDPEVDMNEAEDLSAEMEAAMALLAG